MKLHLLTPAFAAILGLALAGAPVTTQAQPAAPDASAPDASAKAKPAMFRGTLSAVSATSITVQGKSEPMTLAITDKTKITKDKQPAAITDFAVGDKVGGAYSKDDMTVRSLHNLGPKPAAPASQ